MKSARDHRLKGFTIIVHYEDVDTKQVFDSTAGFIYDESYKPPTQRNAAFLTLTKRVMSVFRAASSAHKLNYNISQQPHNGN